MSASPDHDVLPAPESSAAGCGLGCHGGKAQLRRAAAAAGKSETLQRYAADYPAVHTISRKACACVWIAARGLAHAPHRHRTFRSACCVYGLTFTSHFYGARRTVGYVPFNSETLVTGKLFEDIREAVFKPRRSLALRRGGDHQLVRTHRIGSSAATAAEGDQWRAHHRH